MKLSGYVVFGHNELWERTAQKDYFQHPQTSLYYSAKHEKVPPRIALITQSSIKSKDDAEYRQDETVMIAEKGE